jgi:hypothetical protein
VAVAEVPDALSDAQRIAAARLVELVSEAPGCLTKVSRFEGKENQ